MAGRERVIHQVDGGRHAGEAVGVGRIAGGVGRTAGEAVGVGRVAGGVRAGAAAGVMVAVRLGNGR